MSKRRLVPLFPVDTTATKILLDGNTVSSDAIDGNLAPDGKTFLEKAFEGTFVGNDVLEKLRV